MRSFTAKHPLVNLRSFRDRNFAVGCTLIFLFGISLYSLVTVLPLFYQELLGYTAFTAGACGLPARRRLHSRHAGNRLPRQQV